MPIYAYRCAQCGHTKDTLQKMSDAPLTTCPACGQNAFNKQVTAAGFALKGSGWYVTDFKGGASGEKTSNTSVGTNTTSSDSKSSDTTSSTTSTSTTTSNTTSTT